MMIFVTLSLLSLTISTNAALFPIGGVPKTVPRPRPVEQPPQQKPHPNPKPNNNKPQNAPHIDPAPTQAQAQLNNVYGLNRRLEQAETVLDALDIGQSIAEALLATTQTTTVTGSPTVNNATAFATSFAPCKSYASILTSCASATASFYELDYDQQAACVCYQASTNTDLCQAIPTLNPSYDEYEFMCYDFLGTIQASFITEAMDEATVLPGPLLCSWAVSSQTDFTMPPTLSPTTVSCVSSTPTSPSSPQSTGSGGDAARLLTASDRNILAAFALLVVAFSGVIAL